MSAPLRELSVVEQRFHAVMEVLGGWVYVSLNAASLSGRSSCILRIVVDVV